MISEPREPGTISVLIADDHALVRDSLKVLLELQPDLRVVGAAADGLAAIEQARVLHPDIVVLDITMPGLNGIEAAWRIKAVSPQSRVIMLSMHDSAEHVCRALEAGALGYVLKDSAAAEMVPAIRAVLAGRRYLAERLHFMVSIVAAANGPDPSTP